MIQKFCSPVANSTAGTWQLKQRQADQVQVATGVQTACCDANHPSTASASQSIEDREHSTEASLHAKAMSSHTPDASVSRHPSSDLTAARTADTQSDLSDPSSLRCRSFTEPPAHSVAVSSRSCTVSVEEAAAQGGIAMRTGEKHLRDNMHNQSLSADSLAVLSRHVTHILESAARDPRCLFDAGLHVGGLLQAMDVRANSKCSQRVSLKRACIFVVGSTGDPHLNQLHS